MSTVDSPARTGDSAAASSPAVGRNEHGVISIDDRVVAKLAARAALDIADAGSAAPRVLGRSFDGVIGTRDTSLNSLPKATADVDNSMAILGLVISVRWPMSVPDVCARVRAHVADRITELTGLTVAEIQISVTDLVTALPPSPRVS
ncbi:MAG: hypothetical protein JWN95_1853 [Frankiales bacterium]|nr:hypothetical protein [Frankiales bacterium]